MSRARDFADLAGAADAGGLTGRNIVINGAAVLDQRNGGSSVTPTDGQYTLDRWRCGLSQASKFSVQQSTTAPDGFKNSILVTSLSAYSLGASDLFLIEQRVEGLNSYQLNWGASGAQSVTLSFWVRSSLTGTFGGSIRNSDNSRSYPFSYTISSADTWEKKSVAIDGDTSGTWLTTNGTGLQATFGLGVGTSFSGTADAWASSAYLSSTGATSVVGTSGATFYITGIQLEVGSATPFEHRSFADEYNRCSRYLKQYKATTLYNQFAFAHTESTTSHSALFTFDPPMRDTPSAVTVGGNIGIITQWGLGVTGISAVSLQGTSKGFTQTRLVCTTSTGVGTAGETNILLSNNNASSTINFDAEL